MLKIEKINCFKTISSLLNRPYHLLSAFYSVSNCYTLQLLLNMNLTHKFGLSVCPRLLWRSIRRYKAPAVGVVSALPFPVCLTATS